MSNLYIILPKIDKTWLEKHETELLSDATDQLYCFGSGCDVVASFLENATDDQMHEFFFSDNQYERKASRSLGRFGQETFEEYDLWNKQISTAEDIEAYNEAVGDLIHYISAEYEYALVKYFDLKESIYYD